MNDYFLHHAIQTAKTQMKNASIDSTKFTTNGLINLAMQLSIVDKLDTIAGDVKDVETELLKLNGKVR